MRMIVRLGGIKTITAAIYDNSVVYKTKLRVSNIYCIKKSTLSCRIFFAPLIGESYNFSEMNIYLTLRKILY